MASGGARARSGPPPDPTALRRERDGDQWVTLPAAGRKGRAPNWPLSRASAREETIWKEEWKRPQAIMWRRHRQELEVALYVRTVVAAEKRNAPANVRNLVRQQQEALGISLPGLARNRWRIAEEEPQKSAVAAPNARKGARERFTVHDGGKS